MSAEATEPGVGPCPQCRLTTGVRVLTSTSPQMRGWSCELCRARWWIGGVGPGPRRYRDLLSAQVELAAARSVRQQLLALAEDALMLSDEQLRARLVGLARGLGGEIR